MSGLHETFAGALRSAREASGWSQAELADRIGLSVEAYGRLERGRVLPRTSTLVRIAKVLEVTLDGLLGISRSRPGSREEAGTRALLSRIREASPEDVHFVMVVLSELQRWKRGSS